MARGGALQRLQPISDEAYTAPPYNSEGPTKYMTTPYDSHMESIWQGVVTINGLNLFYIGLIESQPITIQDQ